MKTKAFYTAINTNDMEKSLDFYTRLLGFEKKHEIKTPVCKIVVIENGDGARIDLMEVQNEQGFRALRTSIDDVEAAAEELRLNGYEVQGPMNISTGKAILVKDPNGIVIDLTQHIKKS